MAKNWSFGLVRALVRIIQAFETDVANPADLYYCYRLLLNRRPDDAGWSGWLGLLQLETTRPALVDGFMGTIEYQDKAADTTPARVELDHGIVFVDPNDRLVSQSIVHLGTYEPHVTAVLKRLLVPSSVFVDIGANMGWFTLLAAKSANLGKVIAIEPNFSNVQLLFQSIMANGLENVVVYPYAVTNAETILELSAIRSNATVATPGVIDGDHVFVRGVTLDELLRDEPTIDIIKIDIEGYEPAALEGMRGVIRQHRPVIVSEFHPKFIRHTAGVEPESYLVSLVELGYTLSVILEDGQEMAATPELVMQKWKEINRQHGVDDLVHVDLVARPK